MRLPTLALFLFASGFCSADDSAPKHIRVCLQYIEVAHPDLTEMLAAPATGGAVLHGKALALCQAGKAKILETCVVVCGSGRKATVESIRAEIYGTEYQPPSLGWGGTSTRATLTTEPPVNPADRMISAYETRNTGVTLEVEPTLAAGGRSIELHLVPELITPLRLETWMQHVDRWGDASIRMPVYETWRSNTSVSLAPGSFELVSVITPRAQAPAPAVSRKVLVFVRADVVTAGL